MQVPEALFKKASSSDWSRERIEKLTRDEIEQLRTNAERLGASAVVAVCDEALKARPKNGGKQGAHRTRKQWSHLISRSNAFQVRGVYLGSAVSWSGVRKTDGMLVMGLWASSVLTTEGSCRCLLWAPNIDGSRPWSDLPAGRERLQHCQLALERGGAEGLLVHGESMEGRLPEDRARTVLGVDPDVLVRFRVERLGEEYWAVWGGKPVASGS